MPGADRTRGTRRGRARFDRIPIRLRLTLAFAAVMTLVLVAIGSLLVWRFQHELDRQIEQNLASRASDVTALVRAEDNGLASTSGSELTQRGESVAQIVTTRGTVVDATPQTGKRPLLRPDQLRRARRETVLISRQSVAGIEGPLRLLATPVAAQDQQLVVVVGAQLGDHDDALKQLASLLLIGGPLALLLASLAGYGVAAAALSPVERMRTRAAQISEATAGERLPVPAAADEIQHLAQTLNDMLGRLELAFARERRFVSDASHELRTPLAVLKAEIELALRDGRSAGEMHAALRSAGEEADRLTQLAEDLLVIARSDQGALPVRREHLDAHEVAEGAASRFRARAAQGGQQILVRDPETPVFGELDRLRIEQALGNVIDNALRHGRDRVEVTVARDGDAVRFEVLDNGEGFPPAFAATAFDRFSRADSARGRGGAGLGLAIVKAITDAHGGSAGVESRAEGGARVWIRIPDAGSAV